MCAPFPQKYKVSFGVPGFAISQYHTATNPYFAISKSKTALEMVFTRKLCHSAQRTLCHCEEQRDVAISRKGNIVNNMVFFVKLSKGHSC